MPAATQAGAERAHHVELAVEHPGQPAHALGDPLRGREAVGQPQLPGAQTVGVEGVPGHVGDPGGDRAGQHGGGVEALGQGHPDVEPAVRLGPGGALGHVARPARRAWRRAARRRSAGRP